VSSWGSPQAKQRGLGGEKQARQSCLPLGDKQHRVKVRERQSLEQPAVRGLIKNVAWICSNPKHCRPALGRKCRVCLRLCVRLLLENSLCKEKKGADQSTLFLLGYLFNTRVCLHAIVFGDLSKLADSRLLTAGKLKLDPRTTVVTLEFGKASRSRQRLPELRRTVSVTSQSHRDADVMRKC
jgi:hypothetical protein